MKKAFFIPVFFLILASFSFGQSQRMVLLEEFTSSTCGPCVAANAKIHTWLQNYPDVFTAIFYHMSWPAPGNDPMYLANTIDNNARRTFYNVNSVPNSVVDGNVYNGNGNNLQWSVISNRSNVPSPFDISMQHALSAANDEIFVTMVATATQAVSGNLIAHNVVIEELVQFANPPGTNGETSFDHVMKKMLPSKDGTSLPDFEDGDYVIIETSWPFEPSQVYDIDELMAVGFIQNNTSKEVYQAANSSTNPVVFPYDRDIQVLRIENVSATNCTGLVTPIVTVRNNGNDAITSFDLNFQVNGGTVISQSWTGSLAPLEKAVIGLPDYTFTPEASNTLTIYSDNPNSDSDEYPKNDTLNFGIDAAPATTLTMILFIKTDNSPEETTWDVKDALGNIVDSGGPYSEPNHIYRDTIYLTDEGCFIFTIFDAGGDGLCCSNGNGLYLLQDNQGTEVIMGGQFGSYETAQFNANIVSAGEYFDLTRALRIFPNPADGMATAAFYLSKGENVRLDIFDTFGRKVLGLLPGYLDSGEHQVGINTGALAPGVYILRLTTGSKVYSRKMSVSR